MELKGEYKDDMLHRAIYATDASVYRKYPAGVAYPENREDLKKLVHYAREKKLSLIPRTAGTSLAGQCVGEGIVVDVSRHFTRILSIDREKATVDVEPGVIRDELNTWLKPYGLFFGPNTSTSNRCMIGGMVGNNSSGTTSIQYGVTGDKVLEMDVMLSDGSEVTFGELDEKEFKEKIEINSLEGHIYRWLYDTVYPEPVKEQIRSGFPKPEIHRRNNGYALDEAFCRKGGEV